MFEKIKKEFSFNVLLVITLITGVIFIYSTYAWFSASLNVVISDFRMTTESTDGIYISLDGITWSDSIDVTKINLLSLLSETYPEQITQWSDELAPVSIPNLDSADKNKFDVYMHKAQRIIRPNYNNTDALTFFKVSEDKINKASRFMAFDVFIKNVTPSPYSDNLYVDSSTSFKNADPENTDDTALNALRMGIVFSDVTSIDSSIDSIQGLGCNGRCRSFIYEPYSYGHSEKSISDASKHGVTLREGMFYETYAVNNEGSNIKIWSGVRNDKVELDYNYFKLQNNMTDLSNPVFQIPKGIVKARLYIWIEGQDIDIIEHAASDYKVSVSLKFRKDHASLN